MEFSIPVQAVVIVAFSLNLMGLLMAVFFGPPYLIMSPQKRAYLAGAELDDPYIRKAAFRDCLAIIGILLFLAGIALHVAANLATGPLHFHLSFRANF